MGNLENAIRVAKSSSYRHVAPMPKSARRCTRCTALRNMHKTTDLQQTTSIKRKTKVYCTMVPSKKVCAWPTRIYYGHKQISTYDKSFRIRSEVFNDNHFSLHSLICNLFTGLTSRGREVATGRPTVKRRIATYAIMPECLCFGELNGAAPGPGDMTSLSSR